MDEIDSLENLFLEETTFDKLYQLVLRGFESELNIQLNEIDNPTQYLLRTQLESGAHVSLLMTAALNGHDHIVRLLLNLCHNEKHVELKGKINATDGKLIDGATALYCACYYNHFHVAKTLIEVGKAKVNQITNNYPHYSLLHHAVYHNRLDIVRFLIENKYSDVHYVTPRDRNKQTALSIAALNGFVPIVKYLIENGADLIGSFQMNWSNFETLLTRHIDHGSLEVVRILLNEIIIGNAKTQSVEQLNNLFRKCETTVCCKINIQSSTEQLHSILNILVLIMEMYKSIEKDEDVCHRLSVVNLDKECQTIDEINAIKGDRNRIINELLFKCGRLFFLHKDESVMKPFYDYGTSLIEQEEYEQCFDLWIRMFNLYQQSDNTLGLHLFVWIFCKMLTAKKKISIQRFLQIARLVFEPYHGREIPFTIYNGLFFLVIGNRILQEDEIKHEERNEIYRWIKDLCRYPLTSKNGQTLLHLCVDPETSAIINYQRSDIQSYFRFPNESALKLLITFGRSSLDLDVIDPVHGNTPLHLACQTGRDTNIIKLLLNSGCHVHCVNKQGKLPKDYVKHHEAEALFKFDSSTPLKLKCLCARVITNQRLKIKSFGSTLSNFNKFLILHGYLYIQNNEI